MNMHVTPQASPHAALAYYLGLPLTLPPDASPRAVLSAEIDRLILVLDILDGDPDLEPTGDDEPSLCRWGMLGFPNGNVDVEHDDAECEVDDADSEPSLGSLCGTAAQCGHQIGWSAGARSDCELDNSDDEDTHDQEASNLADSTTDLEGDNCDLEFSGDEHEPSLGSLNSYATADHGASWSRGDNNDRELTGEAGSRFGRTQRSLEDELQASREFSAHLASVIARLSGADAASPACPVMLRNGTRIVGIAN